MVLIIILFNDGMSIKTEMNNVDIIIHNPHWESTIQKE